VTTQRERQLCRRKRKHMAKYRIRDVDPEIYKEEKFKLQYGR
jgi:hypothetical protein